MKKYQLTINEQQLKVIQDALDLYSRVGIGQLETVCDVFNKNKPVEQQQIMSYVDFSDIFNELKMKVVGKPLNASFSITNQKDIHNDFRIAFDLKKVIDYKVSWERQPEGGIGNNFDKPMNWSKEELATLEKV